MKKFLADFIKRLTSRKFLLTLGTALILVANQQWTELVILVSGYVGVEGLGDATQRFAAEKTKQTENVLKDTLVQYDAIGDPSDVNRDVLVPGSEIPAQ